MNKKPNRLARIQQLRDELNSLTANPYGEEQLYAHIGNILKQRRESTGMTQFDAARVLNLSRTSIANLEAGRQAMPLSKLIYYCNSLGLSFKDALPEDL